MRKWLQMIAAGRLEAVAARQRALLHSRDILRRFWAKDLSLWTVDDSQLDSIRSNLAWVDLPEAIEPLLDEIARARDASLRDGLYHWVFLALGSSSLTARALLPVVTLQSPWLFSVLDSSHPSAIRNLEEKIDPVHTGFILSSKAGDKLEDHALFLYFQELLRSVPTTDVSQHFASATEDNSFLSGNQSWEHVQGYISRSPAHPAVVLFHPSFWGIAHRAVGRRFKNSPVFDSSHAPVVHEPFGSQFRTRSWSLP